MIFCGQCGQQLAPGELRCSRCGTAIEPDALATTNNTYPNAPTEEARSFIANKPSPTYAQGQANPPTQQNDMQQQKLVLRPGQGVDNYPTAAASDATSMMDTPMMGGAYPQQSATNYPPVNGSHSGFPPQGDFATRGAYTGFSQPGNSPFTPTPTAYPASSSYQHYQGMQEPVAQSSRGRSAALVIILIGLLFIISAIVLFILQRGGTI